MAEPYPVPGLRRVGFLKPLVTNPRIEVGEYTYGGDTEDAARFENRVLYLSPGMTDRLVIGRYCSIARGVTFIMGGANHPLSGFSAYPFHAFGGGWERIASRIACPEKGDTVVGNDVWLGFEALILPGVRIGDGAVVVDAESVEEVPAFKVDVVDTTGCGDAFSAGFLRGLALGRSRRDAAVLGCAAAALVAQGLGSDHGDFDLAAADALHHTNQGVSG